MERYLLRQTVKGKNRNGVFPLNKILFYGDNQVALEDRIADGGTVLYHFAVDIKTAVLIGGKAHDRISREFR